MQNEIKANELRIGNWVECILSDKKVKIDGISKSDHSFGAYYLEFDNGSKTVIKDFDNDYYIKSIPLTPEILEKAGFEWDNVAWNKRRIMLSERKDGLYSVWYGTLTHGRLDECNIAYLHQLQNLFFCLCGKELEVHI